MGTASIDVERLGGRTVLVTGAGSGIGRATALLCAERGAALAICDTELEDWDWIVPINLMGVVHGCHMFVPAMVARGQPPARR